MRQATPITSMTTVSFMQKSCPKTKKENPHTDKISLVSSMRTHPGQTPPQSFGGLVCRAHTFCAPTRKIQMSKGSSMRLYGHHKVTPYHS